MGIRHPQGEELRRLTEKTLDARFLQALQHGLNCSRFEAHAVLDVVKEIYFPFLDVTQQAPRPGQVTLVALDADEPAGKPLATCATRTICLTVSRGPEDDTLLRQQGPTAFRQARIPAVLLEAVLQGALLTREDLAVRIFYVSPRTISRDLAALRRQTPAPDLPLRGTVHDIGPVLTHRLPIIHRALQGATTSEICRDLHHTPEAVANYLATFRRTAVLAAQGVARETIAFLLHRSPRLIAQYLALWEQYRDDPRLAALLDPVPSPAPVEKGGWA